MEELIDISFEKNFAMIVKMLIRWASLKNWLYFSVH